MLHIICTYLAASIFDAAVSILEGEGTSGFSGERTVNVIEGKGCSVITGQRMDHLWVRTSR